MSDFNINRHGNQCQVALTGDLTATIVPPLQTALKTALQGDPEEVTFDLAKTAMLDSSGIGLLIATLNTVSRWRGRLRVINTSGEILQLLQSMRLVTRLNVSGR